MDQTVVDVRSAWLSKINWTQLIGVGASLAAIKGIDVPPEQQVQMVAGIQAIQAVATWAMKTFFTSTITPSSAK